MTHIEYLKSKLKENGLLPCETKKTYYNRKQAKEYAKKATQKYGKKFFVYRCEFCKDFHLSTKGRDNKKRIEENILNCLLNNNE